MKLEVYRDDLKEEHRNRSCSTIAREHFSLEVQTAIDVAGGATFWDDGRQNYNAVQAAPPPVSSVVGTGEAEVTVERQGQGCGQMALVDVGRYRQLVFTIPAHDKNRFIDHVTIECYVRDGRRGFLLKPDAAEIVVTNTKGGVEVYTIARPGKPSFPED